MEIGGLILLGHSTFFATFLYRAFISGLPPDGATRIFSRLLCRHWESNPRQ